MGLKGVFLVHLFVSSLRCAVGAAHGADDGTDMVTQHMFKLYEKYSGEVHAPKEGNTVRSFKARPGE